MKTPPAKQEEKLMISFHLAENVSINAIISARALHGIVFLGYLTRKTGRSSQLRCSSLQRKFVQNSSSGEKNAKVF
jgi:hypothetical protein